MSNRNLAVSKFIFLSNVVLIGLILLFALQQVRAQEITDTTPSLDAILTMDAVGGVNISPDGSEIAYVRSSRDITGQINNSEIRIVETGTGRDRLLVKGTSPIWSPDGSQIAYFTNVGGSRQIWTISPKGGNSEQITKSPDFIDRFRWAPDSKKIAFLSRDSHMSNLTFLAPASDPKDPVHIDFNNLPMNRLVVVNINTKESTQITSNEYSVSGYEQWFPDTFSWSPDGENIVFGKRPNAKAGSHLYSDIMTIKYDGTEPKMLVEREGMDGYPVWSPNGKDIAFISTECYDWVTISYLYLVNVETNKLRKLTPEFDEKIKKFFWAENGNSILFIAGNGVGSRIYSVDVHTSQLSELTNDNSLYSSLSVSKDGKSIAYLRQNYQEAPDIYFTNLDRVAPKRLTEVNPQIKDWPVIEMDIINWESFDGMEIEGIVYKPLNFSKDKRYPLLVVPHGGPHGTSLNRYPGAQAHLFTQNGWAVFLPNFRGSGNYGEKFLRANLMSWGIGDFFDVMSGVDHLINQGLVNPEKMGISGGSYGGYMTAWTISQTNRFKAAVAGIAITDVPSFIRTTDVPERFESYLGKDQRRYFRSSPMYFADNITTPTLIWHNSEDIRVPLDQGRYLYTALIKNEVPTEFIIYPGEPHSYPRNRRDHLSREFNWLTSWVIHDQRPKSLLQGM